MKLYRPSRCDKDCTCRAYFEQLIHGEEYDDHSDDRRANLALELLSYVSTCRLKRNREWATTTLHRYRELKAEVERIKAERKTLQ